MAHTSTVQRRLGAGLGAALMATALVACGGSDPTSPSPAGAGPSNVARTPTIAGAQGQSGTGDARTTGSAIGQGTLQATAAAGGPAVAPTAGGGLGATSGGDRQTGASGGAGSGSGRDLNSGTAGSTGGTTGGTGSTSGGTTGTTGATGAGR